MNFSYYLLFLFRRASTATTFSVRICIYALRVRLHAIYTFRSGCDECRELKSQSLNGRVQICECRRLRLRLLGNDE